MGVGKITLRYNNNKVNVNNTDILIICIRLLIIFYITVNLLVIMKQNWHCM